MTLFVQCRCGHQPHTLCPCGCPTFTADEDTYPVLGMVISS